MDSRIRFSRPGEVSLACRERQLASRVLQQKQSQEGKGTEEMQTGKKGVLTWRTSVSTGPSTTWMSTGAVLAKTPLGRKM